MKRIKYLLIYRKLLKKNKETLQKSRINNNPSGIRYDWLLRLYTVLNLPFEDDDNIKKYGYYYIDNMVRNHIIKMNEFLLQLGIIEYVRIDTKNVVQIDDFNIKIVLRFKWLNVKFLYLTLSIILLSLVIGGVFMFAIL